MSKADEKSENDVSRDSDVSEDKEKKKNFFQVFISYFKYEKKLDKKINQSLLFNAYIIVIAINSNLSS